MTIDDLEIKDSTFDLEFYIRKVDIEKAIAQDNACCAGANGLMRNQEIEKVKVGLSVSYVKYKKNNYWLRFKTPAQLYVEIVALDRGGEFMKGTYYLGKMPQNEIKRRGKAHSKRPPKHPRPYETKRRPNYVLVGVRQRVSKGAKLGPRKASVELHA